MTLSVLAWIPGGFSRFVLAKALVVMLACAVGAFAPRRGTLPRSVWATLAVGATVFVAAALASATPLASLVGRWPRYEGLPMLGVYVGSAWLGARLLAGAVVIEATTAMSWALLAVSALDVMGLNVVGSSDVARNGSVLGNATDQGLVAMVAALLLAGDWLRTRATRSALAAVAAVAVVGISGSRAALLLTVVGLVALWLWDSRTDSRRVVVPAAGTGVVLLVTLLVVPTTRDRLGSLATVHGRLLQWKLTLGMVADRPLLGFGPSRYVDAFGSYETPAWVRWAGVRTFPDSPHDWLLQLLVAGGVPLLLCGLALAWFVVRLGWRATSTRPELRATFVAVTAYGVAMLANFTIVSSTAYVTFLAGGLVGVAARPSPAWRRWAAAGLSTVAAACLLVGCVSEVILEHGMAQAARGHLAAATHAFDTATGLRPADPDAHMLAAQALAALADGKVKRAAVATEDQARASLARTPGTYASQIALGVALIAEHRLMDARSALTLAIHAFPERPAAYVQRGIARLGLQDPRGAVSDVETARRLDPHSGSTQRLLREIRRQVRQHQGLS